MKRNVIALTLLGATAMAGTVMAIDQDIDVSARMRIGLAFSNVINMDFTPGTEHIDFYGIPTPGTDYVTMGTNGTLTASTAVFETSAASGTPGSLSIDGDDTSVVEIGCTDTATLAISNTTAPLLTVDHLEIAMNTGVAYQDAAAHDCTGVASVAHTYTLTGTDILLLGGRLDGAVSVTTALYSSANGADGGVPATIRVLYQ